MATLWPIGSSGVSALSQVGATSSLETLRAKFRRPNSDDTMRQIMRDVGDDGTAARNVHHVAYFNSKEEKKAFETYLKTVGYSIEKAPEPEAVKFCHLTTVISPDFENVVDGLKAKVDEYNGQYDGWGCAIVI